MKKTLLILTCALALAVLLCACAFAESPKELRVLIPNENGDEIAICPEDGVFYLPSSVDVTSVKFDYDGQLTFLTDGGFVMGRSVDLSSCETVDERGEKCYRLSCTADNELKHYTFYHDSSLSSVFVSTSLGREAIDADKQTRDKEARIVILNGDGSAEYSDLADGTESEIKGRGNATFTYMKKPYQIKLSAKTDLFGMGKAKTWILLANYTDQSMLHNALGFHLGERLNVPYNIDYRFVHLYIDGAYRGLYMLCEKVQIDENRVDIADLEKATEKANPDLELDMAQQITVTEGALIENSILDSFTYCEGVESPEDITGGYLVELDFRAHQEPCYFTTENGLMYTVKSPEYASRAEMEYIAGLFADMEEAIYSETGFNRKGVHYSEYIDMESFASVYVVQELMKNWDAYLGSMFFFKDADENGKTAKIYMGPLWDLDNTLGNINFNYEFGQDTAYLWAQDGEFQDYVRTFAKSLMKQPDFKYEVAGQYAIAYSAVQSALAEDGWFAQSVSVIREGVAMDRTRWKLYDSDSWLLTQYGKKSSVKFVQFDSYGSPDDRTRDTALGFMRYFLSARADALRTSIGTADVPPPITPPEQSSSSSSSESSTSTHISDTSELESSPENTSSSSSTMYCSSQPESEFDEMHKKALDPVAVIAAVLIVGGIIGICALFAAGRKRE